MSLPLKAIDRIFDRLATTYGRDFSARFEGLEIGAVKSSWAHELSGFAGRLNSIAWALENLPERAPNVIEFRNLCRKAPEPEVPRLPEPTADPARVATELAKLAPVRAAAVAGSFGVDHKAWAKRIIARSDAGDRINPASLRFAREALRMTVRLGGKDAG